MVNRMKADEFLALPETKIPTELIEGEIIVSPSPVFKHQLVVGETFGLLREFAKENGGMAVVSPQDVYLDDDNVVQPDVMWLAAESRCTVEDEKYLAGVPELIVEVFSPGTSRHDKITKFRLYERFGLPEYWMINPVDTFIEVHTLRDGKFHHLGTFEPGETFQSPVLNNHAVPVSALFARK